MIADLSPLPYRLLQIAVLLGLLLVAVLLNGLLNGDGDGDPSGDFAAAVARTQQAGGGRIAIVATYSTPGGERTIRAHGHGVFNERTGRSRLVMKIPKGLGSTTMVAVGDETRVFIRAPEISRELPGKRSWLGMQPWVGGRSDTAAIGGNGAADALEVLRAAGGEMESLGSAEVRGVSAERFRGSVKMSRYAATLRAEGKKEEAKVYAEVAKQVSGPVEIEAWVWPDGLVRRMRTVTTIGAGPAGSGLTADMVIDLHDLGIAPRISLPPAGKVFDTTPITRAELGLLDGEAALPRSAPAGEPLSAADLRDRANTICALMNREAARVIADSESERQLERLGPDSGLDDVERAIRAYGNQIVVPLERLIDRGLGQLAGLIPPPRLEGLYGRYVRSVATSAEAFAALGRAMQLGSIGTVEKLESTFDPIDEKSDALARELGLHACVGDTDGGSGVGGGGSLS